MKITELQLRSIIRQVINEEAVNESIVDNSLLRAAALVLAAAGLVSAINHDNSDVEAAQEALRSNRPEITKSLQPEIIKQVEGGLHNSTEASGMTGLSPATEVPVFLDSGF